MLLTGTALSSVLVIYNSTLYVGEVEPPIKLYEASAPATMGPNLTSANISYNTSSNYYNAIIYGSFDKGFAGWGYVEWGYLENGTEGVLYGYWYTEGYVGLVGYDIPYGTGYYGGHLIYTNISLVRCPIRSIDFSVNMSISKNWISADDLNITISIYDFNTSSWAYTIISLSFNALWFGSTGWNTYTSTLTWRPVQGHVYALAIIVRAPYSFYIPLPIYFYYSYWVLIDDVELIVTCDTYAVSDLSALNLTNLEGSYDVRLILEGVSGSGNASITLINGAYASTPITIIDGVPSSYSTSYIPFNSSDILSRSGFILVDASLDAGATLHVSLKLEYTTGAIRVYYPVNITLNATP